MNQIKEVVYLPLNKIVPDENQPRQYFDATKIASLANSIKRIGIREPLVVEDQQDGTYKLLDGERRYRAATVINLETVPAIVEVPMNPVDRMVQQFHIQEQHEAWRPQEKAIAIRDISNGLGLSMEEVGEVLGLSRRVIRDYISFVNLYAHKEMARSDVPLRFAVPLESIAKYAEKKYLEQTGNDLDQDALKDFQIGIIKRMTIGQIKNLLDLTKVRDSITQNAKKTVNDISKTDKSADKLFIETNAFGAQLYRRFQNDIQLTIRNLYQFEKDGVLMATLAEDESAKTKIKALIKKLQALPL